MMKMDRAIVQKQGAKSRKARQLGKDGPTMRITVKHYPWDLGLATDPQVENKIVEEVTTRVVVGDKVKDVNPNQVIRTRREPWIARYERQGKLTAQQFAIASELEDASLGLTQQDPLAALRIDRGCSGSDPEAERVDRRRKFRRMWAMVPGYARPVIDHVVLGGKSVRSLPGCKNGQAQARHLDRLQRGLDHLHKEWHASLRKDRPAKTA